MRDLKNLMTTNSTMIRSGTQRKIGTDPVLDEPQNKQSAMWRKGEPTWRKRPLSIQVSE